MELFRLKYKISEQHLIHLHCGKCMKLISKKDVGKNCKSCGIIIEDAGFVNNADLTTF